MDNRRNETEFKTNKYGTKLVIRKSAIGRFIPLLPFGLVKGSSVSILVRARLQWCCDYVLTKGEAVPSRHMMNQP